MFNDFGRVRRVALPLRSSFMVESKVLSNVEKAIRDFVIHLVVVRLLTVRDGTGSRRDVPQLCWFSLKWREGALR